MAASNSTPAQRQAFAAALNAAMKARELRPVDLIPVTGSESREAGQSAAQSWVKGKTEPLRAKVTELEQLLDLEPGSLQCSKHQGPHGHFGTSRTFHVHSVRAEPPPPNGRGGSG